MAKRNQHENCKQILIEAIDEALAYLGENVKTSAYFHLEESFKLKRQDIPQKINDFSDTLERIFGPDAKHLEVLFIKRLHAKMGGTCNWPANGWPLSKWLVPEMTFQEHVCLIQQDFEAAKRDRKWA